MGSQQKIHHSAAIQAIDILHQVRSVNHLVQGLCARAKSEELNKSEAEGLFHLMDWQNEKIKTVENLLSE